jgi:hypothetical protein
VNSGQKRPSRRTPVDKIGKIVDGCANLAWLLSVDPGALRTSRAAADYMARHGLSASLEPETLYVAVQTGADGVTGVVGVFRSAKDAEAYAQAIQWPDYQVAPYWLHPFR